MSFRASSGYNVRVRDYGDGLREVTYWLPTERRGSSGPGCTCGGCAKCRARQLANRIRAERRARAQVRRHIMAGRLDHLLTCTFRENVGDLGEAWEVWKRFVRYVRAEVPGWPYVVVPEFQARGAVHFHAAVRGRQDVRMLRRCWLRAAGRRGGNIDVRGPRVRGEGERARLAGYLSKYVTKEGVREASGRQRYRVSEGIAEGVAEYVERGVEWVSRYVWENVGETLSVVRGSGWGWAATWWPGRWSGAVP